MTDKEDTEIKRFMPYLNAVTSSAEGTRRIIYVGLALMTLIFFAMRNTSDPNWGMTRTVTMLQASKCYLSKKETLSKEEALRCKSLTAAYSKIGFPPPTNEKEDSRFEKRIDDLIDHEVRNKNFSLPLLGVVIDENDLWIASGPIILFMMILLNAYLARDLANLRKAKAACPNRRGANLLLMSHVFNTLTGPGEIQNKSIGRFVRRTFSRAKAQTTKWGTAGKRLRCVVSWVVTWIVTWIVTWRIMFFLPVALHAWVVQIDRLHEHKFHFISVLRPRTPWTVWVEDVVRMGTLAVLVLLCLFCASKALKIERLMNKIRREKFARAAPWRRQYPRAARHALGDDVAQR
jgi:hypothetical protein